MIQKGRLFSLQPADLKPGRVHCNKCIISARRPFLPLSCPAAANATAGVSDTSLCSASVLQCCFLVKTASAIP